MILRDRPVKGQFVLPAAHEDPFPTLGSMMYGGAPMTPALLREIIVTFGCDLFNGFGAG